MYVSYQPKAGLKGCGMTKALPLSTTNLAHSLYNATLSLPDHELEAFLIGWHDTSVTHR